MILFDKHQRIICWGATEETRGIHAELVYVSPSVGSDSITLRTRQGGKEFKVIVPKEIKNSFIDLKVNNLLFPYKKEKEEI